jgi:hypothetical protein
MNALDVRSRSLGATAAPGGVAERRLDRLRELRDVVRLDCDAAAVIEKLSEAAGSRPDDRDVAYECFQHDVRRPFAARRHNEDIDRPDAVPRIGDARVRDSVESNLRGVLGNSGADEHDISVRHIELLKRSCEDIEPFRNVGTPDEPDAESSVVASRWHVDEIDTVRYHIEGRQLHRSCEGDCRVTGGFAVRHESRKSCESSAKHPPAVCFAAAWHSADGCDERDARRRQRDRDLTPIQPADYDLRPQRAELPREARKHGARIPVPGRSELDDCLLQGRSGDDRAQLILRAAWNEPVDYMNYQGRR